MFEPSDLSHAIETHQRLDRLVDLTERDDGCDIYNHFTSIKKKTLLLFKERNVMCYKDLVLFNTDERPDCEQFYLFAQIGNRTHDLRRRS